MGVRNQGSTIPTIIKTHSRVSCGQVQVCETLLFTWTNFKPFSTVYNTNYWADFNQNHVIDALQSHYLVYQIWKESAQWFPRYLVPNVIQISSYFSSSQHSLIHLKTTFPYFKFGPIFTVYYAIMCTLH